MIRGRRFGVSLFFLCKKLEAGSEGRRQEAKAEGRRQRAEGGKGKAKG
jgi:hypothetical protein